MADFNLNDEFDKYFKGVKLPENITADAKKVGKVKKSYSSTFAKFASIAASLILACVVGISLMINYLPKLNNGQGANMSITTYDDSSLRAANASVHTLSKINKSLKFIEDYSFKKGWGVSNANVFAYEGKIALVSAYLTTRNNLSREETQVFVEFTQENFVYSQLADYKKGESKNYNGIEYYMTTFIGDNGEPTNRIYLYLNSVKYYFNIQSPNSNVHIKYLREIINN